MPLSHVDAAGQPTMVDTSSKAVTHRVARARSIMSLPEEIWQLFHDGEIKSKKGPVFATAIIAGIMAAKRTSDLIPFCHPITLEDCKITIDTRDINKLNINCTVSSTGKTGVEMEALTGATVAALTVYDMCKAMSHEITIERTFLLHKSGGKNDYQHRSS